MVFKTIKDLIPICRSKLLKNSLWGVISRIFQTLFLSLFFVIISRHYSTPEFSNYLIATTIYQFMVGISSMGLGTWFIREFNLDPNDNGGLISRFIKIQIGLGVFFYLINIVFVFILYPSGEIRLLGLILGTNIIFDNIIYALSSLNIAQFKQKRTAIIMALDALVRLLIVCLLYFFPISIVWLSFLVVLIRAFTVNLFIQIGTSPKIGLRQLWNYNMSFLQAKKQIFPNWRFVIIVGLSIIFWRSSTIIISKFLTSSDVANYEVAYKILSIFVMLPLIISSTVYPRFVALYLQNDQLGIRNLYRLLFLLFATFSIISFAFIQAFASNIITLVFGHKYILSISCIKEMFLTFLVFPTALLQANLIVAMKKEKVDMYLNMVALGINITGCLIGLHFYKSLSVINYSIFAAFFCFHLIQSIYLNKLGILSLKNSICYYLLISFAIALCNYGFAVSNPFIFFLCLMIIAITTVTIILLKSFTLHHLIYPNRKKPLFQAD